MKKRSLTINKGVKVVLTSTLEKTKTSVANYQFSGLKEFARYAIECIPELPQIEDSSDSIKELNTIGIEFGWFERFEVCDVNAFGAEIKELCDSVDFDLLNETLCERIDSALESLTDWFDVISKHGIDFRDEQAISRITVGTGLYQLYKDGILRKRRNPIPERSRFKDGVTIKIYFKVFKVTALGSGTIKQGEVIFHALNPENGFDIFVNTMSLVDSFELYSKNFTKQNPLKISNLDEYLNDIQRLSEKTKEVRTKVLEACCKLKAGNEFGKLFTIYERAIANGLSLGDRPISK